MAVRRCSQCGAEVVLADDRMSTSCAFCDSPLVASDVVIETIDSVVPFDVTREQASDLLRAFLARQWFAPQSVRNAAKAEAIDGVFVPFYRYEAHAQSDWSARVGIHWYRTETYTTRENGKTVTRTRVVQETEWFPTTGTHNKHWFDHLVSASRGLVEADSNALEPYDLGRAMPWTEALVAGVAAEIPTVSQDEAKRVAHAELEKRELEEIAENLLPGDVYGDLEAKTELKIHAIRLSLLPVWVASVRGPQGPLRLLVNGQTGEVAGTVPRSWAKVGCAVAAIVLLAGSVVFAAALCSGLMAAVSR